jgi:hypothetical protein
MERMTHVHGVRNKYMQSFYVERNGEAEITGSTPIRRWMCMWIHYRDAKFPETDDVDVEVHILPHVDKYYWTLPPDYALFNRRYLSVEPDKPLNCSQETAPSQVARWGLCRLYTHKHAQAYIFISPWYWCLFVSLCNSSIKGRNIPNTLQITTNINNTHRIVKRD